MWIDVVSAACSVMALLISWASLRHSQKLYKSEALKEKFDEIKIDLGNYKRKLDKLSVLEERINNEINSSEKYRDKVDEKLDVIIRMVYEK